MPTPTIFTVEQALLDNADFEEVASVAKAKLFVTAAKRWLILNPASSSNQSSSLSFSIQQIESMMTSARDYIAANDSTNNAGGAVRFLSVTEGFR